MTHGNYDIKISASINNVLLEHSLVRVFKGHRRLLPATMAHCSVCTRVARPFLEKACLPLVATVHTTIDPGGLSILARINVPHSFEQNL